MLEIVDEIVTKGVRHVTMVHHNSNQITEKFNESTGGEDKVGECTLC